MANEITGTAEHNTRTRSIILSPVYICAPASVPGLFLSYGNEARHTFHEPGRRLYGVFGALGRHARAGAGFIVGDSFEVVGAAKKPPQFRVKAPRPSSTVLARGARRNAT